MRKNKNYWTKKRCKEEAKKYNGRAEFKRMAGGAYNSAKKNGWIKEICSSMEYFGNRFKRLVYFYIFSDNSVYVGLTYNINERDNKHKRAKDSSVFRHMQKTGLIPKLNYTDYMHVENAKIIEDEMINKFKNDGYNILNISKAGGVGGGYIKWTFDKCKEEALKYNSRKEFANKSNSAYNSVRRYGWLDSVCSHMKQNKKPSGYWTKESCKNEALKYKSRKEIYKNSRGAYSTMLKNNWLDECCVHMKNKNKKICAL